MALSKRLDYLASHYQGEENVYDIGCDHGLLGLSFVTYSTVKKIYLIDPNPFSVDLIKESIDSYITEPVLIYPLKQSGENTKISSPNSIVFIAGMGGKTIVEILSAWSEEDYKNASQIVVSAHRGQLEMREFLRHCEFNVLREGVVIESGHFYEVLSVSKVRPGPLVSLYGDDMWRMSESNQYLRHQISYLKHHRDEASQRYLNFLKSLPK